MALYHLFATLDKMENDSKGTAARSGYYFPAPTPTCQLTPFLHRMCADNRHLNCHGKQPRRQPTTRTRRKACRWSKSGLKKKRGVGRAGNVCSLGCAFCAKCGEKKILQPDGVAVANIFTPCCHMLNEQKGKMKDKNGGGQAENPRRMPGCLAIVIFVKLTRCQLLPDGK